MTRDIILEELPRAPLAGAPHTRKVSLPDTADGQSGKPGTWGQGSPGIATEPDIQAGNLWLETDLPAGAEVTRQHRGSLPWPAVHACFLVTTIHEGHSDLRLRTCDFDQLIHVHPTATFLVFNGHPRCAYIYELTHAQALV